MAEPGQKPRVTDDELLAVFRDSDKPVLRASGVAEQVSIGRKAVYNRLEKLLDKSDLQRMKLGNVVAYYLPAEGTDNESNEEEEDKPKFSGLDSQKQVQIVTDRLDNTFQLLSHMDEDAQDAFRLNLDLFIAEYSEELSMEPTVPDLDHADSEAQAEHWEKVKALTEGADPHDVIRDDSDEQDRDTNENTNNTGQDGEEADFFERIKQSVEDEQNTDE